MKKLLFYILFPLMAVSCKTDDVSHAIEAPVDQTPEVLMEDSDSGGITSYAKRGRYDIISKLFEEARNKDPELDALVEDIELFRESSAETTRGALRYKSTNLDYWNSLSIMLSQLNDSSLSQEMSRFTADLREQYLKRTNSLDSSLAQIEERKLALRDQEVLMKAMVTLPMMANYQVNELPDITSLVSLGTAYDSLMLVMKPYATIE